MALKRGDLRVVESVPLRDSHTFDDIHVVRTSKPYTEKNGRRAIRWEAPTGAEFPESPPAMRRSVLYIERGSGHISINGTMQPYAPGATIEVEVGDRWHIIRTASVTSVRQEYLP